MRPRIAAFACTLLCPLAAFAQSAPQIAACPVQPTPAVTDADRAFAAGNFAQAESLYAAIAPATPISFAGLVNSQIEQNKVNEAVASAQKAAAALPTSADALALTGIADLRAGQIPEASAAFTKSLTLDRCSPLTLYGLAQFNELLSRHLTAARELNNARHIAPWNPMITAAWIMSLPTGPNPTDDTRTPTLHAFLASKPALPPATLDRLTNELAILEQHLTCTPVEPAKAPVSVTIDALMLYGTHPRSWGVKPKINNVDLPLLELDTSVSGIVLNPGDAKKSGVHPLPGAAPAHDGITYAVADHVKIGPVEYQNCPVRIAPAVALAKSNSLIGTDFFRDRMIKLDYVKRQMVLTPYADSPTGLTDPTPGSAQNGYVPAYIAGSNIILPTMLNGKGPILMLLDTGSTRSILAPALNGKVLFNMHDKDSNIHGSSGVIIKTIPKFGGSGMEVDNPEVTGPDGKFLKVSSAIKVPVLRFANNEFTDESILSFDITPKSHDTRIEIGGLLGFTVLREFYIDLDYRNGVVRFNYDNNHLYLLREHLQSGRDDSIGATGPNP